MVHNRSHDSDEDSHKGSQKNSNDENNDVSIDSSSFAFWKKKKKSDGFKEVRTQSDSDESDEYNSLSSDESEAKTEDRSEHSRHHKHHRSHSKHVKRQSTEDDSGEDSSISGENILHFFYKNRAVFLLLIPIFLMIMFRMYPSNVPAADDWAKSSYESFMKNQFKAQVDRQYPNLPAAQKDTLAQKQYSEYYAQNKDKINAEIKGLANSYREQIRDENGYTYLGDIDSYVWLRYAENIVKNGHVGDRKVDGASYDDLIYAPFGAAVAPGLYPYVEAYLYQFLHVFNPKITVMRAAFYTPFFFSLLGIIAAFFLVRRVAGTFGGLMASIMVAVHPFFLSRTFGSDTDAMVVTFPLIILWMFIEAIESKSLVRGIVFAALAGLFEGIYSFGWVFWYVFDFIMLGVIIYIVFHMLYHHKAIQKDFSGYLKSSGMKNFLVFILVFVVSTGIFVSAFVGFKSFYRGPLEPFNYLAIKSATGESFWPNVYTTVAELNPANVSDAISSLGGKFLFVLSLLGIVFVMFKKEIGNEELIIGSASFVWFMFLMWDKMLVIPAKLYFILLLLPVIVGFLVLSFRKKITDSGAKFAIILALWFAATLFASQSGVRFVLLLVPIFAVTFGICAGVLYAQLSKYGASSLRIDINLSKVIAAIIVASVLIIPIQAADRVSRSELPLMNDGWYLSLKDIRDKSASDAIINSWWDFGHHFKYVAHRKVTFDGASQNTPIANWIGKTLLTSDEDEAIATLRMLDCGSNRAFEEVDKKFVDTHKSVLFVRKIILLDKSSAKADIIAAGFTPDETQTILNYTHCSPPEDYFITSEDMIGKSGVWAHFGIWDFERAEIWFKVRKMPKDDAVDYMISQYGYSKTVAEKIYYEVTSIKSEKDANAWIAPWPSYAGSGNCQLRQLDNLIVCNNGILVNTTDYETFISTKDGFKHLQSLVYLENGVFVEKKFNDSLPFSGTLVEEKQGVFTIYLTSPEIAASMFNRLFILNGAGLSHFEKFSDRTDVFGHRIIVWKVNWEGLPPSPVEIPPTTVLEPVFATTENLTAASPDVSTVASNLSSNISGTESTKDSANLT